MSTISVPVPVIVCDCGHPPTQTTGIGTGYARRVEDDKTLCYDCAAEEQRQEFRDAKFGDALVAYVNDYTLRENGVNPNDSRKIEITTWPGGVLGRGYLTPASHQPVGGRMHGAVVTIEGRTWHGRYYPHAQDCITLRLYKNQ